MEKLLLDFYGVKFELRSQDPISNSVLGSLREDFDHFVDRAGQGPVFSLLELFGQAPPQNLVPRKPPLFKTKMCRVYGFGKRRVCRYGAQSLAIGHNTREQRNYMLWSADESELHEMAYTTVLSVVGESLDGKSYHRVHALGVQFQERGGMVVLPSGGGKSALALLLLKKSAHKILSDETPLVRGRFLYPFPTRIAINQQVLSALGIENANPRFFKRRHYPIKTLLPIPQSRVAGPLPLSFVVIGKGGYARPAIHKASFAPVFWELVKSMAVGIGVAQMAEHMLRLGSAFDLARIFRSRLRCALEATKTKEKYVFHMTHDAKVNFECLSEFFGRCP